MSAKRAVTKTSVALTFWKVAVIRATFLQTKRLPPSIRRDGSSSRCRVIARAIEAAKCWSHRSGPPLDPRPRSRFAASRSRQTSPLIAAP